MLKYLNLPVQASAHAPDIDHVLSIEHWMMLVLFVFWLGYFIYALVRFRAGAHPRRPAQEDVDVRQRRRLISRRDLCVLRQDGLHINQLRRHWWRP